MINVRLPDGSIAQFPDDTDDATIERVLQQEHPPTQAAAPPPVAPPQAPPPQASQQFPLTPPPPQAAAPPAPSPVAPTRANEYNTPLSPDEQGKFQDWAAQLGQTRKQNANAFEPWMNAIPSNEGNPAQDMKDYDIQGAFKAGAKPSGNGHLPDDYKKPWHPTFSDESIYHGQDGHEGGKWIDKGDNKWDFEASPTNLKYHSADELKRYFNRVEPDSNLILPDDKPTTQQFPLTPPAGPPKKTYKAGFIDPIIQAVTLESGDEMGAGVDALIAKFGGDKRPLKDMYSENVGAIREGQSDYRRDNPGLSLLGTVAGSLVVPGGLAARGASKLPSFLNAVRAGGITGAISGFNAGEDDLSHRAGGATLGGVGGAMVGGALSGIGSAAKHVYRTVIPGNIQAVGDRVLAQALERGKGGLKELLDRFDAMRTDDTPGVLADTSKGASDLTRTVHSRPSAGSELLEDALNQRSAGSADRIRSAIRRDVSSANPNVTIDELRTNQRAAAGPAYDKARASGPIYDDEVARLLTNPNIKKGIRHGVEIERNLAMAENRPFDYKDYAITGFNDAGDPIMGGVPNVKLLDAAKRGLDDQLDKYRNPVTGRLELDQHGRSIDALRRKLLERMDAGSDDYRIARETYAEPQESINAVQAGRSFMRGDYDRAGQRFEGLNPENQDYYRAGVARELEDATRKGRPTSDHATALLNEGTWNRLDQILPSARAERLRGTLKREQTINRTLRKVAQGAPTARITAGQDDAEHLSSAVATAAFDATSFGFGTAARNLLRRGSPSSAGGLSEGLADYLAPKLLTSDRSEIESLQRVLMDRLTRDTRRAGMISTAQGAIPAGLLGDFTANSYLHGDRR